MFKIIVPESRHYDEMYKIHVSQMPLNDIMTKKSFFDEFKQENRYYFAIIQDNMLIGYIGLYEYDDDLNIIGIAIEGKFQQKGYGSILIEYAKQFAKEKNKKSLSLEVDEKNKNAINFYKSKGFVVTNIRKKYYKDNDAFVMFLYL